jgi:hypothetical protein
MKSGRRSSRNHNQHKAENLDLHWEQQDMQLGGPFPDDSNGDVLRRLQSQGDDLSSPRDVDFTVIFPDEQAACGFAEKFRIADYAVTVEMTECNEELPWDVRVTRNMVPTHAGISLFEDELGRAASDFNGRNDGWGCFSQLES